MLDDGGLRREARGLAVAIMAQGEPTSAIEITVPAEAISAAELTAELGEPLRAAASALQAMLAEDCANQCVTS